MNAACASPAKLASVVVLNLNGEAILRRCLDSLLAQTYPNFEIVLVDNHSTDGSIAIATEYLSSGKLSIVRSDTNRGVAEGRNLGALHVQGELIAFMDNDGFPNPEWLSEAVHTLESDETVGAVASLVFFDKRKLVLNGAGGTVNCRGYGADNCFHALYEFATLPREVLYPMGCGMVIRRDVFASIGPFDPLLFNYYDDVELGIRVWTRGWKVVLSPDAWVDHGYNFSDSVNHNKVILCERNRIRTVLKYFPLRHLPRWLFNELRMLNYLKHPGNRSVPFSVWAWNLLHLPSAIAWRLRFPDAGRRIWKLVEHGWGIFPAPLPNSLDFAEEPAVATNRLVLDGASDSPQLSYGWYPPSMEAEVRFRWSSAHSVAIVRLDAPTRTCAICLRAAGRDQRVQIVLRPLGHRRPARTIMLEVPPTSWEWREYPCVADAGTYELLLTSSPTHKDSWGRELGIGVASIEFR